MLLLNPILSYLISIDNNIPTDVASFVHKPFIIFCKYNGVCKGRCKIMWLDTV